MEEALAQEKWQIVEKIYKNKTICFQYCPLSGSRHPYSKYHHRAYAIKLEWRNDCTPIAIDLAALYGHLDSIKLLHYNQSVGWTTKAMGNAAHNRLYHKAMDCVAIAGHLDVIKFLHYNRNEGCTTSAMNNAAFYGHLDVVNFLHYNWNEGCTTNAMNNAALHGHLDIVRFLHYNRNEGCSSAAIDNAAYYGHLDY